jgi:hypothetical protein
VINLNSNIPTFVVTEPVIKAETPGLVSLAETIASSQDLADKVAAFVGINTTEVGGGDGGGSSNETNTTAPGVNESGTVGFYWTTPPPTPSSANFVWTTSSSFSSLLSWVGLLLLPLIV